MIWKVSLLFLAHNVFGTAFNVKLAKNDLIVLEFIY